MAPPVIDHVSIDMPFFYLITIIYLVHLPLQIMLHMKTRVARDEVHLSDSLKILKWLIYISLTENILH